MNSELSKFAAVGVVNSHRSLPRQEGSFWGGLNGMEFHMISGIMKHRKLPIKDESRSEIRVILLE